MLVALIFIAQLISEVLNDEIAQKKRQHYIENWNHNLIYKREKEKVSDIHFFYQLKTPFSELKEVLPWKEMILLYFEKFLQNENCFTKAEKERKSLTPGQILIGT